MKTIKTGILLALSTLMLSSCEGWLDVVQEGTIPTEELDYTDTDNMYAPVSGVYASVRSNFDNWELWPIFNLRGDDVVKGGGSDQDQYDFLNLEKFNYSAIEGFWANNNSWVSLYKSIFATYNNTDLLNRFREHLTNDADRALADQYEGEIIFHRALTYYYICRVWGNVPIIDANDVNQVGLYRHSVARVRKHMHDELDRAIELLPERQTVHLGAVTKYTAMTLKAKIALDEANYTLVESLTDEIIAGGGYSLFQDYYNLFKIPGKLCSESIYELQFTDFGAPSGDQVYGGAWFQSQGPRNSPAPISGWGFMLLDERYINFMQDRGEDARWHVAVLESGVTTPAGDEIPLFEPDYQAPFKAYYNGKPYTPKNQLTDGRNDYGGNNNIRVLRYADVLLMNAEAKVRQGKDGSEPFNLVRTRAGMAEIASPTIEQIIDERRAEFSVEWGERFNDMLRTGTASDLEGFVAGQSEYVPVPTTQIDLNPYLALPVVE